MRSSRFAWLVSLDAAGVAGADCADRETTQPNIAIPAAHVICTDCFHLDREVRHAGPTGLARSSVKRGFKQCSISLPRLVVFNRGHMVRSSCEHVLGVGVATRAYNPRWTGRIKQIRSPVLCIPLELCQSCFASLLLRPSDRLQTPRCQVAHLVGQGHIARRMNEHAQCALRVRAERGQAYPFWRSSSAAWRLTRVSREAAIPSQTARILRCRRACVDCC